MALKRLHLEVGKTPYEWGLQHGESFRKECHELAEIRTQLICENWQTSDTREVERLAHEHLAVLQDYDENLYQEFLGIAKGSGLSLESLVVLNHYTDLRDLHRPGWGNDEGCSMLFAKEGKERFLGQTWDMHGSAVDYVLMLHVPGPIECWILSLTGCLGMCGLNTKGLGVTINNLISEDAKVGILWPALVRKILMKESALKAKKHLLEAPIGSGHHYVVGDGKEIFAIETSGQKKELLVDGEIDRYCHANHCLDPRIAEISRVAPTSTSFDRQRLLDRWVADESRSVDATTTWDALSSREEYPRAVFTDMRTAENPHAMYTCAQVNMDLARVKLWALLGDDAPAQGETFLWSGEE